MGTIHDLKRKLERFKKELVDLNKQTVPIIADKKGMIDRQCPKEECKSIFKVNSQDWRDIVKDEEVFCPFCRNNSKASEYFPKEQRQAVVATLRTSISKHWKYGTPIAENLIPVQSQQEFEVHIQCEKCSVRFAVVGAAYFCPCCGHNSIERTAEESIKKELLKAQKFDSIKKSLEQTLSKDDAAIITKTMIEDALSNCIGILQAFSEKKYNSLSSTTAPFNAFQNVDKSIALWRNLLGCDYNDWLSVTELVTLRLFTQRRHLLEHKGGFVDVKYLSSTNDGRYTEGEKLIVNPKNIIELGNIAIKIITNLKTY